jgi:large subunit ribosomal protein L13
VKTYIPAGRDIEREWYIVDAKGQNLGRLAAKIAIVLRGKHKPMYTKEADVGDFVIVINAGQVTFTGRKLSDKMYYSHSGYPGGLSEMNLGDMLERHPGRVIERAVRGMLPHNRLGQQMYRKLKVYEDDRHPHEAQRPRDLAEAAAVRPFREKGERD